MALILSIDSVLTWGKRAWISAIFLLCCMLLRTPFYFAQASDQKDFGCCSTADEAQANGPTNTEQSPAAAGTPEPPGGKRVFGVLPNFRTVDQSSVTGPLTSSQKFAIASKDSFDYPLALVAVGLAGMGQWSNQHPAFGQELGGFSKRYVTTFADQAVANVLTEAVFPVLLHEDPRYYRRGDGSTMSRMGYALSRLFVTPTDSGKRQFNYSEWLGNIAATAVGNAYYSDGRTVSNNLQQLGMQLGLDGLDAVLKEFWPDIKQKFFTHHRP